MKSIILARVSTEEQKEAGNSLPAQIERVKNYCQRKGFEIVETFSFDESAYKTKRDEFDRVLEYLKTNKEKIALCFDKVDRFSRNVFDKRVSLLYEKAVADEIELHFVSDNQVVDSSMSAVEKFHFGISLGLAKYYSDAISDNVKRVFEQKRRSGAWVGKPRIGYINITLEDGKKDIVPDPERAHFIQKLFELYATGAYSITLLWEKITAMGLRGLDGNKLARSNIELILQDTFYYGMAYSKKHGHYPHRYQPLITKELFDKCQEVRASRRRMPSKLAVAADNFIFKGLLPCKKCGCLYTPELKIKKSGRKYVYYSCTNAKHICERVYVPEKTLLEPIQKVFEKFRNLPKEVQERLVSELRALNEGETEFHNREINRIRAEYDRVQKKVSALLDLRLEQSITSDDYDKKLQELKDKQYLLNIELEEYTKADHQYHIHVNTVLNLSRKIADIFESSEPMEKRAILGFILQNPMVSGKKLEFTMRKPFDTVLELAACPTGLPALHKFRNIWHSS
jgi:DNA invertase Pin-like site-specific DNA recombinase